MENMKRLLEFVKARTGERLSFSSKQYFVHSDGRVWNHEKRRFLKQTENHNKYMAVHLIDNNGKQTSIYVHNLVVSVFQRLLNKGEQVHHINHVKSDNRLENLTIIDGGEHARRHTIEKWKNGTMDGHGEKMKKAWATGRLNVVGGKVAAKLRKQVVQLSLDGQLINVWPSTRECGRNGFDHGSVSECCRNCYSRPGNNVYKGYVWQWYEDYQKDKEEASHLEQLASE